MIKFIPKIFSNDTIDLQKQVLNTINFNNNISTGIEVALYGYQYFPFEIEEQLNQISCENKILHLWQNKVYLNGFINKNNDVFYNFNFENKYAKQLNIKKAVIHNNIKSTPLNINKKEEITNFAKNSLKHIEYCYNNGLFLHIENTYENLDFFKEIFNIFDKHNFNNIIGFCLDTGHTRALIKSNLYDWLDFIKELKNKNFSIHYHIHVNDSSADQHYNLSIGNARGMLEPDEKWNNNKGFLTWLKDSTKITPNALFCLEHDSAQATEARYFIDLLKQDNFFN